MARTAHTAVTCYVSRIDGSFVTRVWNWPSAGDISECQVPWSLSHSVAQQMMADTATLPTGAQIAVGLVWRWTGSVVRTELKDGTPWHYQGTLHFLNVMRFHVTLVLPSLCRFLAELPFFGGSIFAKNSTGCPENPADRVVTDTGSQTDGRTDIALL